MTSPDALPELLLASSDGFAAALRAEKAGAERLPGGMTFRRITEIAAGLPAMSGAVELPRSSVSDMLRRTSPRLPTEAQLRTLLTVLRTPPVRARQLHSARLYLERDAALSSPAPAAAVAGRSSGCVPGRAEPVVVGTLPAEAVHFQRRAEVDHLLAAARPGTTAVLTPVVVAGLGGLGKTQLAAHLARHLIATSAVELLVWAPASTRTAILTSYAAAAARLRLSGRAAGISGHVSGDVDSDAQVFLAWLTATGRRWAVVLDDLTDPVDIHQLWPPTTASGQIVITTRRRDATLLAGRAVVDVGVFSPDTATAYLAANLPTGLADDLPGVADDLGCLPLALGHAAAYMLDQNMSCARYRARFADQRHRLAQLFPDPATLFDDTTATVASTWALSIAAADRLHPLGTAGRVLELASMLDAAGIPIAVLGTEAARTYLSRGAGSPAEDRRRPDRDDVTAAVANVGRFSLAVTSADTMQVHALVQRAVRDQLTADQADEAARAVADALLESWPDPDREPARVELWRANAATLEHARPDVLWSTTSGSHPLMLGVADSLAEAGLLVEAIAMYQRLQECTSAALGHDHPDVLIARYNLARWRGEAGDSSGAAEALAVLLPDQLRVLGPDHRNSLLTRTQIALRRGEAGDPSGAAEALAAVLPDWIRVLGPDDPDTITTRGHVARWLGESGDPVGAAEAFAAMLAHRTRLTDPDHEDTINTRYNLAYWSGRAGDPAGAAAGFEALLPDVLRVLGPDHPHTLATRLNLVRWRGAAGDLAAATAACEALLPDVLRVLGPDHPRTLGTRSYAARWRGEAGDRSGAAAALEALLTDRVRVMGPDHPETLATRSDLAYWRGEVGDPAGAVAAFQELLRDELRVLGPDHPKTLGTRHDLAVWRGRCGESAESLTAFEELLPDQLRVLGPDHPTTLRTRHELARRRGAREPRT